MRRMRAHLLARGGPPRLTLARIGASVACVIAGSSLSVAVGAASDVPFSPALVARVGTTNVLYVVSESPACTVRACVRLERSNDGGRTFFPVTVPPVSRVLGQNTPPLESLYFATPLDGYALQYTSTGSKWASSALFSTFDGGHTWRRVTIARHDTVYGMTSSTGYFYALSEQCSAKGACSHVQLNRSSVGTTTWTKLTVPERILKYWGDVQLAAFGPRVWLSTQNQGSAPYSPYVATSLNDGESFTVATQPQLSSAGSCGLLPVSEEVLWAECDEGNMQGDILNSRDGGRRWQLDEDNQLGRFAFGVFDPVSPAVAYFINGNYPRTLFRATSESEVRDVGNLPGRYNWMSLDMTNAQRGVALSQGAAGSNTDILWRTDDGGTSWSRVVL
jgi:photosystem II stability/assembly factor-like uncharacterized protein